METKKSKKADLERKRPLWFLLGMVLSLSAFLAVLELNITESDAYDERMLNDYLPYLDMSVSMEIKEMRAAADEESNATSEDKIKVVDEETEVEEEEEEPPVEEEYIDDDMTGDSSEEIEDEESSSDALLNNDSGNDSATDFQIIEKIPQFPGGITAFKQWLAQNLKYPTVAQRAKMEGKVIVSFVVNEDGTTSDHKIVKSAGGYFDAEAMRVIRKMPDWAPGMENGQPCRTLMTVPIVFNM